MNHTYRVVFSAVSGTWVAVSETTRARGKGSRRARVLATVLSATLSTSAYATAVVVGPGQIQLPAGGQVVAGQAAISQAGSVMTINQASNRAAIDWQSFNVGSQARVNFIQPSASSVTLNRVLDTQASQIYGRISANGQVFLTNPNGIYFSPSSTVDVGALVATTHSIANADFMAGGNTFVRNGATGAVINNGHLTAALGGYIALLAPEVRNNGVIVAQAGTVALAAGEVFTLQFDGTQPRLIVTPSQIASLVENAQAVLAPGGQIILSAQAANRLQGGVVHNTGSLEATGLTSDGGSIILTASDSIISSGSIKADAAPGSAGKGGTISLIADLANPASTTRVDGSLSARGGDLGGDGGFVETSGAGVNIADSAFVDTRAPLGKTGMWLLDPLNFTIGMDESGQSVSQSLATTDRIITATNKLNVNDKVSWSANTLMLQTTSGDVNINAVMTASGSSSLDLEPGSGKVNVGLSGTGFTGRVDFFQADGVTPRSGNGFLSVNGLDYVVINALGSPLSTTHLDLQGINGAPAGHFALGSNIDATATASTFGATGFSPIGSFTGTFDGLGHTISGLTISGGGADIGLFGLVNTGGTVRNVGLLGGSVSADSGSLYVGALAGQIYTGGTVSNSYATGNVSAGPNSQHVGGLVGLNSSGGAIGNSYATGNVSVGTGTYFVGGLVGSNEGTTDASYATGAVSGQGNFVGGLAGYNTQAISNSHATGSVSGLGSLGGLVGENNTGTVSGSYATGGVSGTGDLVGGLVGTNLGTVSNSYAGGSVTGAHTVGGLLGDNNGIVSDSHATGSVSSTGPTGGGTAAGGLVGLNQGNITGSYATGTVSAAISAGGLVGDNHTGGTVDNSYATGSVSGAYAVGGLVGSGSTSAISFSYAQGSVYGIDNVGGLVGGSNNSTVDNSYATGRVTASGPSPSVGGLVGYNVSGGVTNSYWDVQATGQAGSNGGGQGVQHALMSSASSFAGFTFTTTPGGPGWVIVDAGGSLNSAGGAAATLPMLASEYATTITNAHQLQLMALAPAASYTLAANIDASATGSGKDVWGGAGFMPVGTFTGSLDGQNHKISNLYINLPSAYVGLFSVLGGGAFVGNLGLEGGTVTGSYAVGSLAGLNAGGTVNNVTTSATVAATGAYVSPIVVHDSSVGGLIGWNMASVSNSSATGNVSGYGSVGGLIGRNQGNVNGSHATGTVTGGATGYDSAVGGLVGYNDFVACNPCAITNSYATGHVTGDNNVGGLVGWNGGSVALSYASGAVSTYAGGWQTGGLVGYNRFQAITDSYATGAVAGVSNAGGLVGQNDGPIISSYATGSVSASNYGAAGLVGLNYGFVNSSYWNTDSNPGLPGIAAGVNLGAATGLSGSGLRTVASLTGFGFSSTPGAAAWVIVDVDGTLNNAGGAAGATLPMLASEYATTVTNAHQLQLMALAPGASYTLGADIDASATRTGGDVWGSAGFVPVGNSAMSFTGRLDGQNHTINSLAINLPTMDDVGLFGVTGAGAVISKLGLVDARVRGANNVGGLVAENAGTVSDSYVSGDVTGSGSVGGLVAYNSGTIDNSFATGSVTGLAGGLYGDIGGLVANNASSGQISNSHSSSAVYSTSTAQYNTVGGLVGYNDGAIRYSYASGGVTGAGSSGDASQVGGLVGMNANGSISDSYATGSVTGGGSNAGIWVGGLVGYNWYGSIATSYAAGSVGDTSVNAGMNYLGYLVGYNGSGSSGGGSIASSFWISADAATVGVGSDRSNSQPGASRLDPTSSAQSALNFAGFNFTGAPSMPGWVMVDADGGLNNAGGIAGATLPMLASEYSTTVRNAHQLQLMALAPGANYILATNIDASATGTSQDVWQTSGGFVPVGNSSARFNGTFDGLGQTISGLTINRPESDNVGLFGYTDTGAVIRNVGLVGNNVSGASNVGALVGQDSGWISNSYATGNVNSTAYNVGGLVGTNWSGLIDNSYASGTVSGIYTVGGLVGYNHDGSAIRNSYATARTFGNYMKGGLVGANDGLVATSYAAGLVSGGELTGGLVGLTNRGSVVDSYWDIQGTSQDGSSGGIGLQHGEMASASSFAGFAFTSTPGAAGWVLVDADGSLNNAGGASGGTLPMLASEYASSINNAHQLQLMAMAPGARYSLRGNIDAAATGTSADVWGGNGFIPVGSQTAPFAGSFDGRGRTVSDLTINAPMDYVGLFGAASAGAVIRNVGLLNDNVTGNNYVGGLVGSNAGTVSDSYATGSVRSSPIISWSNFGFDVQIDSPAGEHIGGLVGFNGGTVSRSFTTGSVSRGGMFGYDGLVENGTNFLINLRGSYGGLVGDNAGVVVESFSTANVDGGFAINVQQGLMGTGFTVSGATDLGGLAGRNTGTIKASYATGGVTGSGLLSSSAADRISMWVSGAFNAGGLLGSNAGTINGSFWNSDNNSNGVGSGPNDGAVGMSTADMQSPANFTGATAANGNVNPGWGSASSAWRFNVGSAPCLAGMTDCGTPAVMLYVRETYSSGVYGSPTLGYELVDGYGRVITPTNFTLDGAPTWSNAPTSSSDVGAFNVGYLSGLSLGGSGASSYVLAPWGTPTLYALNPQPVTFVLSGTRAYDGTASMSGSLLNVSSATVDFPWSFDGSVSLAGRNAGKQDISSYFGLWLNNPNYTIASVTGWVTIDKASATVTANSGSATYNGATQSVSGFTATGLVGGETASVLSGVSAGGTGQNAGTYASSASGTDGNYSLSFVPGSFTIAKAALTATGNSLSTTYSGANQSVAGFTVSGLQGADTVADLVSVSASGATGKNAGSYVNTLTAGTEANYTVSPVNGSLVIAKASATVTANSGSATYNGAPQSVSGFTATGLVGGETASVLSGVSAGGTGQNAGIYASSAGGTDGNYSLSFVPGSFTIAKAALTVTASAASKTYDGQAYAGGNGVSYAGLVGTETAAVLGGSLAYAGSAQGAINAGSYAISPTGLSSGNYAISYADGSLTVNKAHLAVTADDKTRFVGDVNPALTATLSGFVNGETAASAGIAGAPTLATLATQESAVGAAPITAAPGTLFASNYDFPTFNAGLLTIAAHQNTTVTTDITPIVPAVIQVVPAVTPVVAPDTPVVPAGTTQAVQLIPVQSVPLPGQAAALVVAPPPTLAAPTPAPTLSAFINGDLPTGAGGSGTSASAGAPDVPSLPASAPAAATTTTTTTTSKTVTPASATTVVATDTAAAKATVTTTDSSTTADAKQTTQPSVAAAAAAMTPRFVAFRAAETARHEAATVLYRPALDVIRQRPAVADVPSCSSSASDACIPAARPSVAGKGIRHKVAVLIGNNAYSGGIPVLATPAGDVQAVGDVLKQRMGYEVQVLKNAGKRDIILALKHLAETAGPEDSVVVMYAGHGYEMEDTKQGFWLPADANAKDPKTWVSNNDITRLLNVNPAKQILLVSDSCFSGTLTKEQKVETKGASSQAILDKRSVVALSSGGEEPVSDEGLNGHSIFAYHLIQTLSGVTERTTASEIHRSVKEEVEKDFPQEPQLGGVVSAGHTRGGDYLFRMN